MCIFSAVSLHFLPAGTHTGSNAGTGGEGGSGMSAWSSERGGSGSPQTQASLKRRLSEVNPYCACTM